MKSNNIDMIHILKRNILKKFIKEQSEKWERTEEKNWYFIYLSEKVLSRHLLVQFCFKRDLKYLQ
jgi:hypothetical protein